MGYVEFAQLAALATIGFLTWFAKWRARRDRVAAEMELDGARVAGTEVRSALQSVGERHRCHPVDLEMVEDDYSGLW